MFANGTDFPAFADVTAQLNAMVADLPMSEAEAFSIDDAATNEIDDAFSVVDLPNGNKRVGIHIAAPALAVLHGSDLDAVVLDRLSTVYMPGNKITMLPEAIVRPFSLDEGEIKPALSLYCEVAPDLTVVANKTKLERIKVKQNLRHDSLEPFLIVRHWKKKVVIHYGRI